MTPFTMKGLLLLAIVAAPFFLQGQPNYIGSVEISNQMPDPTHSLGSAFYTITINRGTSSGSFNVSLFTELVNMPVGAQFYWSGSTDLSFSATETSKQVGLEIRLTSYADAGVYSFKVIAMVNIIGAAPETESAIGYLNVCSLPVLVDYPPGITKVCLGEEVSLGVTATSTDGDISFQWMKLGTDGYYHNIPGETSHTLTISSITIDDLGSYGVSINNDCGGIYTTGYEITADLTPPQQSPTVGFPVGESGINDCYPPLGPTEEQIAALFYDDSGGPVFVNKSAVAGGDVCDWWVTYQYDISDQCGNMLTKTITYSGGDQTPPVADCGHMYIPFGVDGYIYLDASYLQDCVYDNCDETVEIVIEDIAIICPGNDQAIPITMIDGCENTSNQNIMISGTNRTAILEFIEGPTSNCPGLQTFQVRLFDQDENTGIPGMNINFYLANLSQSYSPAGCAETDSEGIATFTLDMTNPDAQGFYLQAEFLSECPFNGFVTELEFYIDNTQPVWTQAWPSDQYRLDLCEPPEGYSDEYIASLFIEDGYSTDGMVYVTHQTYVAWDGCDWTQNIIYMVTDNCGNQVDYIETIVHYSGRDQTPPSISISELIVHLGIDNTAEITPEMFEIYVSDDCEGPISISIRGDTSFDCEDTPGKTIYLILEDQCGNESISPVYIELQSRPVSVSFIAPDSPICRDVNKFVALISDDLTGVPLPNMLVRFTIGSTPYDAYTDDYGYAIKEIDLSGYTGTSVWVAVESVYGCPFIAPVVIKNLEFDNTPPSLKPGATFPYTVSGINSCAPTGGPSSEEIASLFEDDSGLPVNVEIFIILDEDNISDCGWTRTFHCQVSDHCGNIFPEPSYVIYTGSDQTPPQLLAGAEFPPSQSGIDACLPPWEPTADQIALLFTDNCSNPVIVTRFEEAIGDKCNWTMVYTYKIEDHCGNVVEPFPVIQFSGGDQTRPLMRNDIDFLPNLEGLIACEPFTPYTDAQIAEYFYDECEGPVFVDKVWETEWNGAVWTTTYVYDVSDECGNVFLPKPVITVQGRLPGPVAICRSELMVSLQMDGTLELTTDMFDLGSYDFCGLDVELSVCPDFISCDSQQEFPVILTVTNTAGQSSFCTTMIEILPRIATINYSGPLEAAYGETIELVARLLDDEDGLPVEGQTVEFVFPNQEVMATTDAEGYARATLVFEPLPGTGPETWLIINHIGTCPYLGFSITNEFTIRASACAEYTGDYIVITEANKKADVNLSAYVNLLLPPPGANITQSQIQFYANQEPIGVPVPIEALVFGDLVDHTSGTASYKWLRVSPGVYEINARVIGQYNNIMTGLDCEAAALVTVAIPSNDYTSGGGYLFVERPAGLYIPYEGSKNHFGFSLKFNKKQNNIQGTALTIIRVNVDGQERVLRARANTWSHLNISGTNASFAGFAAVEDVTDFMNPVSFEGRLTMQMEVTDYRATGESTDRAGISLTRIDGTLWYASDWIMNLSQLRQQPLAEGDIMVPVLTGPVYINEIGDEPALKLFEDGGLSLNVYPNPFRDQVSFDLVYDQNTSLLLEVYDIRGAKLATLFNGKVEAGQIYHIEYEPQGVLSGILIYRLMVDGKVLNGKVVYQK